MNLLPLQGRIVSIGVLRSEEVKKVSSRESKCIRVYDNKMPV